MLTKNYEEDKAKFIPSGRYSVGLYPEKKDSLSIIRNLRSIGFVIFNENNQNYHLFSLKGECDVRENSELYEERARNMDFMPFYVTLEIDTSKELDSSQIFPISLEAAVHPIYMDINAISKKEERELHKNN